MRQEVKITFLGHDPNEITAFLELEPTEIRLKGQRSEGGATWQRDHWLLSSGVSEGDLVAERHFDALLQKLATSWQRLKTFSKRVKPTVHWTIKIGADEETPASCLSARILERLSEIQANLDVDIYVDCDRADRV